MIFGKLKLNKTDRRILNLLKLTKCSSDIEIQDFFELGFHELYPSLNRLQKLGLIVKTDNNYCLCQEQSLLTKTTEFIDYW